MKTFWTRTLSASIYALLFVGSIYADRLTGSPLWGAIIFAAFMLFVAEGCTFEYYRIVARQGVHPMRTMGYFLSAMVCIGFALSAYGMLRPALLVMLLALPMLLILQLWHHSEQPFADAAHTLLPAIYAALPLGLMPLLHSRWNVMMMVLILVWLNDSFAYMGGSLLGRHKMWPRHSPGKTWEGTAIGVAGTIATALLVGPLFDTGLMWYDWCVVGLLCSIVGTLGDLAESMLKRSVGLKDSGNIMPGHGGFLDRFDSLLIITPFVAAYLMIRF
ncbi:MAG: phosphatidate cytidylyltransferase [Bacteroidales bacterium]|nr:phosphatidate cytidylyltransferase [Bacteroidales bacterium]